MLRAKVPPALVILLLTACQPAESTPTAYRSPVPWETATPTFTPVIPTTEISSTPTPAPTPTPVLYKVKSGDTFSSIAVRNGITIDALRAANPKVQELYLSIGQELVIPAPDGTPLPALPTPTPVSVDVGPTRCFAQRTGGQWCLALVSNPGPEAVGGIRVQFLLYDSPTAEPVASQETLLAPESLSAGERAPAAVFFPADTPPGAIVRAEVTGAVPAADEDPAVPLTILSQESNVLEGGLEIVFDIRIASTASADARRIEAVATLLDSDGQPVGLRRLEAEGNWAPGHTAQFTLRVYSLAADTGRFELLVRAHADSPPAADTTPTPGP
jgi:LysM repeat protein